MNSAHRIPCILATGLALISSVAGALLLSATFTSAQARTEAVALGSGLSVLALIAMASVLGFGRSQLRWALILFTAPTIYLAIDALAR